MATAEGARATMAGCWLDTGLDADSVEFCPRRGHSRWAVAGTYKLRESDEGECVGVVRFPPLIDSFLRRGTHTTALTPSLLTCAHSWFFFFFSIRALVYMGAFAQWRAIIYSLKHSFMRSLTFIRSLDGDGHALDQSFSLITHLMARLYQLRPRPLNSTNCVTLALSCALRIPPAIRGQSGSTDTRWRAHSGRRDTSSRFQARHRNTRLARLR